MKFLCDVHISYKIVNFLIGVGFETIHVNSILDKWFTKDEDICKFADENNMIVLTKDSDFKNSFLIRRTPQKLIKISLGNISNNDLINVLEKNLELIQKMNLGTSFLIEINKNDVTFI